MKKVSLSLILILLASSIFSQTPHERAAFEKHIKPNQVGINAYLFVNPLNQDPHQCQTTCVSMLLSYGGINITPASIEMASTGKLDGTPTMWKIVETLLKEWNIPLRVSRYDANHSSVDHIIGFFKDLLDHNTPCYFLANYHAIVVQGYDEGTREIYCIDPTRSNSVLVFTYEELMNHFLDSKEYKKGKSILIAHQSTELSNYLYLENNTFIYKKH
jgi:ABC-type bacteriocin/lantibiotic exporter with double-glycine peptidase domain